jgi:prophage antirepressor-like protein
VKIERNSDNRLNERLFTFAPSNQTIRVEIINGELWFIAKDVCDVLSISNNRDTVSRLDDDEKATSVLPTQFGDKEMWLINESGLYSLIFQSRKPEARAFRKWVTSEVLPALRKTGEYQIKKRSHCKPVPASSDIAHLLQLIADNLQKNDKKTVAVQLGVNPVSISNILSGKTRSNTILQALCEKALENKRNGFVNAYSSEFVTTAITKLK